MIDFNFNKYKKIMIIAAVVIVVLVIAGFVFFKTKGNVGKKTACTEEAKVCPDGTSVSRTGPKCEFKACPKAKNDKVVIHTYLIEKDLKVSCKTDGECMLPREYSSKTNCKFSTLCLSDTCNVICPTTIRATKEQVLEFEKFQSQQGNKNVPVVPKVAPKK